jgi:VanZ family protein
VSKHIQSAIAITYIALVTLAEVAPLRTAEWRIGVLSFDKLAHAVSYAVMLLLLLPLCGGKRLIAGLLAFAHGVAIELIQVHLPYRTADPYDLLANTIGIFLAVLFVIPMLKRLFGEGWCE